MGKICLEIRGKYFKRKGMTDKAIFYLLLFTFIVTAATMINDKVIEKKGGNTTNITELFNNKK